MEAIVAAVAASGKYAALAPDLVRRVIEEEAPKYGRDKERIKAVKNRLHQIYGAYLDEGGFARAEKRIAAWDDPAADTAEVCRAVLGLHASTRERLDSLDAFYTFVRTRTGPAASALDIGCGLNPFVLPLLEWPELEAYHALDIDLRLAALNNRLLERRGLPPLAGVLDAVAQTPEVSVDVAFLFKLLPVLEAQRKGRGMELLSGLNARRLVVSFPARSLGGREKGMARHYAEYLEGGLPGDLSVLDKAEIGNELVYILTRQVYNTSKAQPSTGASARFSGRAMVKVEP